MALRKVKIVGSAYNISGNASITVDYNGLRVFSGDVATRIVEILPNSQPDENADWGYELGEFDTDTDTTGEIPVVITVTAGKLFFANFRMNMQGTWWEREPTNPEVTVNPGDDTTFTWELNIRTEDNFGYTVPVLVTKFGEVFSPDNPVMLRSGEFKQPPPVSPRYEITNTVLNSQEWTWRTNFGDLQGEWAYPLSASEVFEFDYFVDPEKIIIANDRIDDEQVATDES